MKKLKPILRISTAGNVDDGKSTLIGRMMYETKSVPEDQYEAIKKSSDSRNRGFVDLSLLLDGLESERSQGITIDVAYRYIESLSRRLIIADSPGHEQYTRNMITGASNSDISVVLIDASHGISTQSKRHAYLSSLLGITDLVVVVNKMDLVGYKKSVFEKIKEEFLAFTSKLGLKNVDFVPVSALNGDNVVTRSKQMAWYSGQTFLKILETIEPSNKSLSADFRMFVQMVVRSKSHFRGFAGRISSGKVAVGDELFISSTNETTHVKEVITPSGKCRSARQGDSVVLVFDNNIDIDRGVLLSSSSRPNSWNSFRALLVWMGDKPMDKTKTYVMKHGTRLIKTFINSVHNRIDVNTLGFKSARQLSANDIGFVTIESYETFDADVYEKNKSTGSFILIDADTNDTVAAGMIHEFEGVVQYRSLPNVRKEKFELVRKVREKQQKQHSLVVWFTGLSGSGKSTIANELQNMLWERGFQVYTLDGDNIRGGLNSDLSFSVKDRMENIRRISEVAKLFVDAGVITLVSFISPIKADREKARDVIGKEDFVEIYVSTPLDECERRDTKGLYQKARSGEIPNFTGISSPYEPPEHPTLVINTAGRSVRDCAEDVWRAVKKKVAVK